MISLKKSFFAPYLEDISEGDLRDAWLLESEESSEFWKENFDENAKGLYDLPDNSWPVQASWSTVGQWINAYNGLEDTDKIADTFIKKTNWAADERLFLVQNRQQIIFILFCDFVKCWDSLFSVFDDGPILMSRSNKSISAFRFTTMGDIIFSKVTLQKSPAPRFLRQT